MKARSKKIPTKLRKKLLACKLVVMDFDGVLTDNKVYTDQNGIESVRCDRSDGLGFEIIRNESDIKVLILSKEKNSAVAARAKKLKAPMIQGANDKVSMLQKVIHSQRLVADQVCYIGNDINDIGCMKEVGLAVAVADSYPLVLSAADYISRKKGGEGAAREIFDLLLEVRGIHPYQKKSK